MFHTACGWVYWPARRARDILRQTATAWRRDSKSLSSHSVQRLGAPIRGVSPTSFKVAQQRLARRWALRCASSVARRMVGVVRFHPLFCLTSCAGQEQSQLAHARAQPEERVELTTADADVWAWHVGVSGVFRGPGRAQNCTVLVGDRAFPVASGPDGRFVANVSLGLGTNAVRARCPGISGSVDSKPVRFWVRLRNSPAARANASMRDGPLWLDAQGSEPSPTRN